MRLLFQEQKDDRRRRRRRRCRCRASAEAKFPISEDTEDPRYKWELGIGQMRFITERFTSLNLFP